MSSVLPFLQLMKSEAYLTKRLVQSVSCDWWAGNFLPYHVHPVWISQILSTCNRLGADKKYLFSRVIYYRNYVLTRVKIHFPVKCFSCHIYVLKTVKFHCGEKYVNAPKSLRSCNLTKYVHTCSCACMHNAGQPSTSIIVRGCTC